MRAYAAARVLKGGNGGVEGAKRHAISDLVWWATTPGPADAECGRVAVLDVGEWMDGDPRNCTRCVRALARVAQSQFTDTTTEAVPVLSIV